MLDFSVFRVSEHSWAVLRFVEKAHEILWCAWRGSATRVFHGREPNTAHTLQN